MSLTGEGQTAIDGHPNLMDAMQQIRFGEVADEDVASAHGADGVGGGRANADGEEIES